MMKDESRVLELWMTEENMQFTWQIMNEIGEEFWGCG